MLCTLHEPIHVVKVSLNVSLNRRTHLLFAISSECGIHDCQVLKYQPSVTSKVIFHHLIPLIIIKYQNIILDVTDG